MFNYYEHVKGHPEIYKQFSCKNILFLLCECPPDFKKSEDWSNYNAFSYILSGQVVLHSRQKSWHLKHGDTMFMKKGGWGIEKTDNDSFCSLVFYIPDSFIRSFVRENASRFSNSDLSAITNNAALPVETNTVLAAFYDSVASYFFTGTQPSEDLLELKFRELLLNIVSNPVNCELRAYFYKLGISDNVDLKEVMDRNWLYNLQLHEFAKLCHRSLSSFKRDFQEIYGISPGRWLLEKRLDHASKLLIQTAQTVNDVVVDSGFKNIAHFDRVFKKQFGISPLRYRKQFLTELAEPS